MGGLFTPKGYGIYVSTKHALEAVAEVLSDELKPWHIKVQTINPGAYLTGYNETIADNAFRWLDDDVNFTKRADMKATFDALFGTPQRRLDPQEIAGHLNIHPNYLNAPLKKKTGQNASTHIRSRIPDEAKTLLLHADWSLQDIGYSTGFADQPDFNLFF